MYNDAQTFVYRSLSEYSVNDDLPFKCQGETSQ